MKNFGGGESKSCLTEFRVVTTACGKFKPEGKYLGWFEPWLRFRDEHSKKTTVCETLDEAIDVIQYQFFKDYITNKEELFKPKKVWKL
jgi:hypothetical protein